jgi:uncharacterized membrane protein YeaQ/YmgE (transglycosylase-associated protein family)
MEGLLPILIQAVAGAVGGNAVGKAGPHLDQGWLINTIVGFVGGGFGGQVVMALLPGLMAGGAMAVTSVVTGIVAGFVGGGLLLAILGLIKDKMVHH